MLKYNLILPYINSCMLFFSQEIHIQSDVDKYKAMPALGPECTIPSRYDLHCIPIPSPDVHVNCVIYVSLLRNKQ